MVISDRASWTPEDTDLDGLRSRLQGEILRPGDEEYDSARAIWNGSAEGQPALIVRCADAVDVSAAITFARAEGLPIAVRSGGHSVAGHSTSDGVVIDLSSMKGMEVDVDRRVARLEPGLTWGEVARTLHPHGLGITAGDTASVGVGGLTLGGGIGWMVRKHGLAIDNLRAVEIVTADGSILRASATENPDLFWGLRGGGGNFGVATAFEFNLHSAGMIFGGGILFDASDPEEAVHILQAYARIAESAPDELTTQALLMAAPPAPFVPPEMQGRPVVAVAAVYAGDLAEGERVVAPLRTLGSVVADVMGPMPYPAIFALTEIAEVKGMAHHVRSHYLKGIDDDALRALAESTLTGFTPEAIVQLRVLGGAMSRVPAEATAFAHRDKRGLVMISHMGPPEAGDAERRERTETVWRAMQPYASGVYVNFLEKEGEDRVRDAYPPATYTRLAALKARYDPTNVFRLNQNITPAL
jgi:FAD/FMN-containing dehydrogenase